MQGAAAFFSAARERYKILLRRRAGGLPPWTEDEVFQRWRFCNVHREDDKTTAWFRQHVREPLRRDPRVLVATAAFRWFNRIETGEALLELLLNGWDSAEARRRLRGRRPVVTGAFMTKTPAGMNKADGTVSCIDSFTAAQSAEQHAAFNTLREGHRALVAAPYLGGFTAYEIITDLRHTYLYDDAADINTWCHIGPGATRGAGRAARADPRAFDQARDQESMLELCSELLAMSRDGEHWPSDWPRWEMREVEHWLCEFDKYERARLGQGKMKRRYRPTDSWKGGA